MYTAQYWEQIEDFFKNNPTIENIGGLSVDIVRQQLEEAKLKQESVYSITKEQYENQLIESIDTFIKYYKELLMTNYDKNTIENSINMKFNHNPRYILRNYLIQKIIKQCQKLDFKEFNNFFNCIINPYSKDINKQWQQYEQISCDDEPMSCLSCSS